jgi:hypothetical protein
MGSVETTQLIIDSITGDADRGGWECNAAFLNQQGFADYSRRAVVHWLPEGAGVWNADWQTALRGFILPKRVEFDRGQSRTDVLLATSHVFLENAGVQGIYFASVAVPDPDNPHQKVQWNLGKIVEHIVEQHTNIQEWVDTSGIDTVDSTDVNFYTVHETDNLWQLIKNIGSNEFYVPFFTKNDELIYRVHPMFATSLPEPVMEIDSRYIVGQPSVIYRDDVRPDQVQLYALTDDGEVLKAFYPAQIGSEGKRHKIANIRCNGQARLNQLAHRLYTFLQRNYQVNLTLAGPWGLNMELYDRVEVTYTGTSINGVGFVWSQKKFWISRINIQRVHDFGAITELTLDEENYAQGYFYTDYT